MFTFKIRRSFCFLSDDPGGGSGFFLFGCSIGQAGIFCPEYICALRTQSGRHILDNVTAQELESNQGGWARVVNVLLSVNRYQSQQPCAVVANVAQVCRQNIYRPVQVKWGKLSPANIHRVFFRFRPSSFAYVLCFVCLFAFAPFNAT